MSLKIDSSYDLSFEFRKKLINFVRNDKVLDTNELNKLNDSVNNDDDLKALSILNKLNDGLEVSIILDYSEDDIDIPDEGFNFTISRIQESTLNENYNIEYDEVDEIEEPALFTFGSKPKETQNDRNTSEIIYKDIKEFDKNLKDLVNLSSKGKFDLKKFENLAISLSKLNLSKENISDKKVLVSVKALEENFNLFINEIFSHLDIEENDLIKAEDLLKSNPVGGQKKLEEISLKLLHSRSLITILNNSGFKNSNLKQFANKVEYLTTHLTNIGQNFAKDNLNNSINKVTNLIGTIGTIFTKPHSVSEPRKVLAELLKTISSFPENSTESLVFDEFLKNDRVKALYYGSILAASGEGFYGIEKAIKKLGEKGFINISEKLLLNKENLENIQAHGKVLDGIKTPENIEKSKKAILISELINYTESVNQAFTASEEIADEILSNRAEQPKTTFFVNLFGTDLDEISKTAESINNLKNQTNNELISSLRNADLNSFYTKLKGLNENEFQTLKKSYELLNKEFETTADIITALNAVDKGSTILGFAIGAGALVSAGTKALGSIAIREYGKRLLIEESEGAIKLLSKEAIKQLSKEAGEEAVKSFVKRTIPTAITEVTTSLGSRLASSTAGSIGRHLISDVGLKRALIGDVLDLTINSFVHVNRESNSDNVFDNIKFDYKDYKGKVNYFGIIAGSLPISLAIFKKFKGIDLPESSIKRVDENTTKALDSAASRVDDSIKSLEKANSATSHVSPSNIDLPNIDGLSRINGLNLESFSDFFKKLPNDTTRKLVSEGLEKALKSGDEKAIKLIAEQTESFLKRVDNLDSNIPKVLSQSESRIKSIYKTIEKFEKEISGIQDQIKQVKKQLSLKVNIKKQPALRKKLSRLENILDRKLEALENLKSTEKSLIQYGYQRNLEKALYNAKFAEELRLRDIVEAANHKFDLSKADDTTIKVSELIKDIKSTNGEQVFKSVEDFHIALLKHPDELSKFEISAINKIRDSISLPKGQVVVVRVDPSGVIKDSQNVKVKGFVLTPDLLKGAKTKEDALKVLRLDYYDSIFFRSKHVNDKLKVSIALVDSSNLTVPKAKKFGGDLDFSTYPFGGHGFLTTPGKFSVGTPELYLNGDKAVKALKDPIDLDDFLKLLQSGQPLF